MNKEVLTKVEGRRSYFLPIFLGVGTEVLLSFASVMLVVCGRDLGETGITAIALIIAVLATAAIPIMIYEIIRTRRLNNASGREVVFNESKDAIEFKDIANQRIIHKYLIS